MIKARVPECESSTEEVVDSVSSGSVSLHMKGILTGSGFLLLGMANPERGSPYRFSKAPEVKASKMQKIKGVLHTMCV